MMEYRKEIIVDQDNGSVMLSCILSGMDCLKSWLEKQATVDTLTRLDRKTFNDIGIERSRAILLRN